MGPHEDAAGIPGAGEPGKADPGSEHTADLYVINRENVCWLVDYYRNAWPFDMVVIDESSSFKSHSAKRFKALAGISSRISRMVELTGTPSPNGLADLWSQVYLLDGGERLGKRYSQFRDGTSSRTSAGQTAWYTATRPSPGPKRASWQRSLISASA